MAMHLADVIDTFTRGFAAARSITHPYLVERVGPLWMTADAPRRQNKNLRGREYVALDTPPAQVMQLIAQTRPDRYALCVVHSAAERDPQIEAAYKKLGMRYVRHEPFFVCTLPCNKRGPSPLPVRRVTTVESTRRIAQAARCRQIVESDATDDCAAARLFAAFDDDQPIGWVTSIRTAPDRAWVANLFVTHAHRGNGIGASLMRALLRDDARRGIRYSVLTASQAGARLYPRVGYQRVGTLQLFMPQK